MSKWSIAKSKHTHTCLTCKKEQDVPFWFSEMDLHDSDQGCIHVVTLRCLGIQNLYRKGAPRNPVLHDKGMGMMSNLLDNVLDLPPFASLTICYSCGSTMTETSSVRGQKEQNAAQGSMSACTI